MIVTAAIGNEYTEIRSQALSSCFPLTHVILLYAVHNIDFPVGGLDQIIRKKQLSSVCPVQEVCLQFSYVGGDRRVT